VNKDILCSLSSDSKQYSWLRDNSCLRKHLVHWYWWRHCQVHFSNMGQEVCLSVISEVYHRHPFHKLWDQKTK